MADSTDLFVVGTGMVGYQQLTNECEQALDLSEHIFLLHPLPEVREYFRERWGPVDNLATEYEQGLARLDRYERMADRVLNSSQEADRPVVLTVYGHPQVGVTPTRIIIDCADERGVSVDVLPGVSSIDCLYTDLSIDPFQGLQLFEATDLLIHEYRLNNEVPALIFQIGLIESYLYDRRKSAPERFTAIREYLEEFYPPSHELCLASTATLPLADSDLHWFELGNFESMASDIDFTHTLYIPRVSDPPIRNKTLQQKAHSSGHLDHITK